MVKLDIKDARLTVNGARLHLCLELLEVVATSPVPKVHGPIVRYMGAGGGRGGKGRGGEGSRGGGEGSRGGGEGRGGEEEGRGEEQRGGGEGRGGEQPLAKELQDMDVVSFTVN